MEIEVEKIKKVKDLFNGIPIDRHFTYRTIAKLSENPTLYGSYC